MMHGIAAESSRLRTAGGVESYQPSKQGKFSCPLASFIRALDQEYNLEE
jgi:hypothetical protein